MKCVFISCFNHYDIRIKAIRDFFESIKIQTFYLTSDFDHYKKNVLTVDYQDTKQIHVNKYKHNLSIARIISHFNFSKNIYKELIDIKPDFIYCIFPPNSLVKMVSRYKKIYGAKVIFDCFDLWPESYLGPDNFQSNLLPFSIWRNLRDKYIDYSDMLICCSNQMLSFYNEKRMPKKLLWPSICRKPEKFGSIDVEKNIQFCIIGMINYIIDLDLVIKFLGNVSKDKETILHIIGEGDNLEILENDLRTKGIIVIKHGVIFDFEKKQKIVKSCNFGINMPKEKINSSMALKFVEYLNLGLPVINSGVGDSHDLVEKEHIGFNVNMQSCTNVATRVSQISTNDMNIMQCNCFNVYKQYFSEARIASLFNNIKNNIF